MNDFRTCLASQDSEDGTERWVLISYDEKPQVDAYDIPTIYFVETYDPHLIPHLN